MKNRNTFLFIALSTVLLGIYFFVMNRYQQQAPPVAVEAAPPASTAQEASKVAPTPKDLKLPAVDPKALFSYRSETLNLVWRKQDGALVQVEWKDGTRFFSQDETHGGEQISKAFPGIGGATVLFQGEPTVLSVPGGKTVTFKNGAGDCLVYRVPDQGHVLGVDWESPSSHMMRLLPMPSELREIHNLGRVFTLSEKSIHAVPWMDMLKDPFFSFLGAKRKELPPVESRLGMDAGIEAGRSSQSTHYFSVLWEVSKMPVRNLDQLPGYSVQAQPGSKVSARLYLGPKQAEALAAFSKPFSQVVDFGFFGYVAKLLFWVLRAIRSFVPNWGWAIILFTIVIRGVLWPLNTKTTTQMLRMKDMEPHQKAIAAKYEKYGSDMAKKAEMQKEVMAFYKKNGHNPMGGCLPMLVQMPVFFALWSMLNAVFELRHAPFIGWIHDLSSKDPIYILPLLLGASMFAQQAITPATGDPTQRKMMLVLMPLMMTFFFAQSPAGLALYYLVFNLIGMVQTWWVVRNYKPQPVVI